MPPINEIGELSNKDFYNQQMNNRFLKMQMLAETDPDFKQPFFSLFDTDLELNYVASPSSPQAVRLHRLFKKLFSYYILGHWNNAIESIAEIKEIP